MSPRVAEPVVWIPGGRGMLGQAVCEVLATSGVRHVVSGREVDIAEPARVEAWLSRHTPSHIINCAAKTAVDDCESQTDSAWRCNAEGAKVLAAAARQRRLAIAHVSTDYVFAGNAQAPIAETAEVAPKTVYGQSKAQGERHFWTALAGEPQAYVVRTAWLFGHGGRNFVDTMRRLMRSREQVDVVADQHGSPTFCGDLAAALAQLMGLGEGTSAAPSGTYHFANAGQTSWHGLASATRAALAAREPLPCNEVRPVTSAAFVRPAPRPSYSVLAIDKVVAALGRPVRPWQAALAAYLAAEATNEGKDTWGGATGVGS